MSAACLIVFVASAGLSASDQLVALTLEDALPEGKPLVLRLRFRDGEVHQAFASARTYNVAPHDVEAEAPSFDGASLRGRVGIVINPDNWIPRDKRPIACDFALDCSAKRGVLSGTRRGRRGDAQCSGKAHGEVERWTGLPPASRLDLVLERSGGSFGPGLAFTPHFNHATHIVDASGLQVADGRLRGELKVRVLPDPYVPRDRKPVEAAYRLDGAVGEFGLEGDFTGSFGRDEVAGVLAGQFEPRPKPGRDFSLWLKMEEGVVGTNPWGNRTYLSVDIRGGQAIGGRFSNNKGAWKGTFNDAKLDISDGRLKGTIHATVNSGRVRLGTYTFKLDGVLIGQFVTGDFKSILGGEAVQSGRFVGGFKARD